MAREPPAQRQFKFQSKRIFLTYPQAEIDNNELYAFCYTFGTIKYAVIAKELHQDGNPHCHAVIEYAKRLDFRDTRKFDFMGHHPSIEKPRNFMAAINYCKKDNNYVEFGDSPEDRIDESIFEVAKTASWEDFTEYCLKRKISYSWADNIWKRTHDHQTIREDHPEGVIRDDLATLKFEDHNQRKSLHIQGPTGIGKTSWAKLQAPKPALWVTHMDNLKSFDPAVHKSIIFDDMSFLHVPREAQIHLVDLDDTRSIHIRYGVATIPKGTQRIFTSNGPIFTDDPAIARRVIKHIYS